MRKKLVVVFALTMALVAGATPLAVADHAKHSILVCPKGGNQNAFLCGQQYRGVQTTLSVREPIVYAPDGDTVASLYFVPPNSNVCYGDGEAPITPEEALCDFVEFGWNRDRNSFPYDYDSNLFFLVVVDGNKVRDEELPITPVGEYVFALFHRSGVGTQAAYRPLSQPNNWTWVFNPAVLQTGYGWFVASVETVNQNPPDYDRVATDHHDNMWVMDGNYVWKAAHYNNGAQTRLFGEQMTCYTVVYVSGSGNTGDHNRYPKVSTC